MREVIKLFKRIQETSSLNDKKEIIIANKENELFKKCLKFLLDTNIVTGISAKKLLKTVDEDVDITFGNSFEDCMNYLTVNNTGRDIDIARIKYFVEQCQPEEYKDFYYQMITKKFRLGVDAKTVNKCIPGLIPVWEVQLGSSYDKLKLKKGEWFSLSQKLNGCRASFYQGKLISRQGKAFTGMQHIISDLEQLGIGWFYDGELIRKNVDNLPDEENFRIGTGIINSDAKTKEDIKFVIFDHFSESEVIWRQYGTTKYKMRRKLLNSLRNIIFEKNLQNIEIVTMVYEGIDQAQIMKWLDYAIDHNWEGLMLNKDATYKWKRTTDLIKIKKFYTMDLPVVKVLEGDGRLKGTMGALVVKYKNNTVNVGSGFDDKTREKFWSDKDNIIGRIVEVKYKEITKDKKTGLESLQFPIFVGIREVGKSVSFD